MTTDITWNRLRQLVKRRDKSICFHCGKADEDGACDHLLPLSKGGTDSILNLVWSCKPCNSNKITNDEYADSIGVSYKTDEAPKLSNAIRSLFIILVKGLVPPYPDYYTPGAFWNAEHYRETFFKMRKDIATTWIREQIWNTPAEAKQIMVERQGIFNDNFPLSLAWSHRRYPVCPKCSQVATMMLSSYDNWLCPNAHTITKEQIEQVINEEVVEIS